MIKYLVFLNHIFTDSVKLATIFKLKANFIGDIKLGD
jgi:hypothetical protein